MTEKKCKYCGSKLKKSNEIRGYCNNCKYKLPLAKEFVSACDKIKKVCGIYE